MTMRSIVPALGWKENIPEVPMLGSTPEVPILIGAFLLLLVLLPHYHSSVPELYYSRTL